MTKTVVALYDRVSDADAAVRELVDHGFSRQNISLVFSDAGGRYSPDIEGEVQAVEPNAEAPGASFGAAVGGLSGFLVGLGVIAIPGIGPVVAAGPLAAAISGIIGAAVGGATGGLVGALIDIEVEVPEAEHYAEAVRRGGTLVAVEVEEHRESEARRILDSFGSVDLEEWADHWFEQDEDLSGSNYESDPYTIEEIDRERARYGLDIADEQREQYDFEDDEEAGAYDYEYDEEFDDYESSFHRHYEERYADIGYPYTRYQPAYYYGYELAVDSRYAGWDWDDLEPEAQRGWQAREDLEGEWDNFVDAVHFAWDKAK